MNHSLQEYLRNRSTEELISFLQYCLKKNNYKAYDYIIPDILRLLEQRKSEEAIISDTNTPT